MMLIVSDYAFCQSISPGLVKTEFHGRLEKRTDPETTWESISKEVSRVILVIVLWGWSRCILMFTEANRSGSKHLVITCQARKSF